MKYNTSTLVFIAKKASLVLVGMTIALIPILLASSQNVSPTQFLQNAAGQVQLLTETETQNSAITTISSWETATDKQWILKDLPATEQVFTLVVTLSDNQYTYLSEVENSVVGYEIPSLNKVGRLSSIGANAYSATIDATNFPVGEHEVYTFISVNGTKETSTSINIHVSYPLYVTWTIDWEGYDMSDSHLEDMAAIADRHGVPMTHFFNPRLYTSPDISKAREDYFTNWVINRRDENGDAIGLHLHMHPDLVEAAGVEPIEDPKTWGTSLDDGYDILTSNYNYTDMKKMLEWSIDTFEDKGLGTPKMYRAGGWFADEDVLKAVNDTGFYLDSSGRTIYTFGTNKIVGHWSLDSTTQPYRMNSNDQNNQTDPNMNLWEFPNNGADSWVFSAVDMIKRFEDNYDTTELSQRRLVTYLSHPEWFDTDKPKMEAVFNHLDQFTYANDNGPVVYVTLEDAYNIWSK